MISPSVAASAQPPAPSAVTAVDYGLAVDVTWAPPEVPVDHFNIYGVTEAGAFVLLGNSEAVAAVDLMTATVARGYPAYAVASMAGGVESTRTITPAVPCIVFDLDPPHAAPGQCHVVVLVPRDV